MRKNNGIGIFTLVILLCSSCDLKEVNDDAKSYCDCKTEQYKGKTESGECPKLLATLKIKYEYMPAESDLLAQKIAECLAE